MTLTSRVFLSLPLCLVVVASGCTSHPKTAARVSGKVTYNGKPVPAGWVMFHVKEGGIYRNPLNSDGTYSGADMPINEELVVTIDTEAANPNPKWGKNKQSYGPPGGQKGKKAVDPAQDYMQKMKERGAFQENAPTGPYVKIPEKYVEEKTSPLKVTLQKGNNTLDFDLKD